MRIIAGSAGGRSLESPEDRSIRPTPARVREAIFSILGNIRDAVVVDGFAGTGAMGCEALSRGAEVCYFIDHSQEAVGIIEENLERTDARERGIVLHGGFETQISMIDEEVHLWLLDPPYQQGKAQPVLEAMINAECVVDEALVVIEQDQDEELPEVEGFELEDKRTYGRARVAFLRRVKG